MYSLVLAWKFKRNSLSIFSHICLNHRKWLDWVLVHRSIFSSDFRSVHQWYSRSSDSSGSIALLHSQKSEQKESGMQCIIFRDLSKIPPNFSWRNFLSLFTIEPGSFNGSREKLYCFSWSRTFEESMICCSCCFLHELSSKDGVSNIISCMIMNNCRTHLPYKSFWNRFSIVYVFRMISRKIWSHKFFFRHKWVSKIL